MLSVYISSIFRVYISLALEEIICGKTENMSLNRIARYKVSNFSHHASSETFSFCKREIDEILAVSRRTKFQISVRTRDALASLDRERRLTLSAD